MSVIPALPDRRRWDNIASKRDLATNLLRLYVQHKVEIYSKPRKGNEGDGPVNPCRTFLKAFQAITANGNPRGIGLWATRGSAYGTVEIFCILPGIGRVETLPKLIVPSDDKLTQIMRETLRNVPIHDDPRPSTGQGDDEQRRGFPQKAEIKLVVGRKT